MVNCLYEHPCEFIYLENQIENDTKFGLILIETNYNGKDIKILIDTGSEVSLINENLVKIFNNVENNKIKISKIALIGANNKKLCDVSSSFNLNLELENKILNFQLLIVPNMDIDMVIGSDHLSKYKSIINYENKTIRIDGIWIGFSENSCMKSGRINFNRVDENEERENVGYFINNIVEENNNEVKIDCHDKYYKEIKGMIEKYRGLIKKESRIATKYMHRFEVKDIQNFKVKTYPIPYKYKDEVNDQIKELISAGVIERCKTPYINPVVVVKKKNGEIRLCLDARMINKFSVPQYEAPLTIEAILGRITNTKIFSKLDLKHSFWLIPLHQSCRDYTGFSINGIIYRFCVVPFGIQSACASLVRALHQILDKYEHFVLHYIDDILIYSNDEQEHLQHIEIVLRELNEAGLKLNIEKCKFFKDEIIYLGYKLDKRGIEIDEERIEVIKNYKRPTNLRTLRGFLGILNYYKRLVPDITLKEIPLIELLKKGVKWEWTSEREKSFQSLKDDFSNKIKIYHPRYELPFLLKTDASIYRLAGVLSQIQNEIEVPICFVSRTTKIHEKKYSVGELELLSIIFCVIKLRFYLLGNKFIIETDNMGLTSILNNKFGNARIHRWSILLQEYNYEIKYVSGKTNVVSDALTRMDGENIKIKKEVKIGINIMRDEQGIFSKQEIIEDQINLKEKEKNRAKFKDSVWYKEIQGKELYLITKQLTIKIGKNLHEEYGHPGVRKLWMIFRENYISSNDLKIFKEITKFCKICQFAKEKNFHNENLPKSIVSDSPLKIISVDFISNLIPSYQGNKHIFVILDIFSKFISIYACKRTNTKTVKRLLENYFINIGKPQNCILDNATYFNNEILKKFCRNNQINLKFTSIRHPAANPTERYIKEIIKYLRILVNNKQQSWENYLKQIEYFMNSVPNNVTMETPLFLMRGIKPNRPWTMEINDSYQEIIDVVNERLNKNAENYIRKKQKKIKLPVKFKKGDLVILKALRVPNYKEKRCAKLTLPFEGPYMIETENGCNSYILKDIYTNKIRGVFHITQIFQYCEKND